MPPVQMEARTRLHLQSYPNNRLRSAASMYNCVGMVFASRRTAIDVALVPRILEEDEYRRIRWEEAELGDLVLYFDRHGNVSHVGMIASPIVEGTNDLRPVRVLSQWGSDGEFVHPLKAVPALLGAPEEVWTDRVAPR